MTTRALGRKLAVAMAYQRGARCFCTATHTATHMNSAQPVITFEVASQGLKHPPTETQTSADFGHVPTSMIRKGSSSAMQSSVQPNATSNLFASVAAQLEELGFDPERHGEISCAANRYLRGLTGSEREKELLLSGQRLGPHQAMLLQMQATAELFDLNILLHSNRGTSFRLTKARSGPSTRSIDVAFYEG